MVHEMDVDFHQTNRNRRPRTIKAMTEYTKKIFCVSNAFLKSVDNLVK